jgi:hypothetical protein
MELSPSREVASCAATQELLNILWNPKFHNRVVSKINFNIIHSPMSTSS